MRRSVERRKSRQRVVHLRRDSSHPVVADLAGKVRIDVARIDEFEERPLRVRVRDDGLRQDLFAALEDDADGAVFADENRGYGCARSNLGAERLRGRRDRVRQRTEPATHGLRWRKRLSVDCSLQEKGKGSPCRPGTGKAAVDASSGDCGAQQVGFKELRDEIGDSHRSPSQQPIGIALSESAEVLADLQERNRVTRRRPIDRRRRRPQDRPEDLPDAFERSPEFAIPRRVLRRELRQLGRRSLHVVVEAESAAVRIGRERANRRRDPNVRSKGSVKRPADLRPRGEDGSGNLSAYALHGRKRRVRDQHANAAFPVRPRRSSSAVRATCRHAAPDPRFARARHVPEPRRDPLHSDARKRMIRSGPKISNPEISTIWIKDQFR